MKNAPLTTEPAQSGPKLSKSAKRRRTPMGKRREFAHKVSVHQRKKVGCPNVTTASIMAGLRPVSDEVFERLKRTFHNDWKNFEAEFRRQCQHGLP
jgi:hypothetical protein